MRIRSCVNAPLKNSEGFEYQRPCEHRKAAQGAGGYDDIAGELIVTAHLLDHGERRNGGGRTENGDHSGKGDASYAEKIRRREEYARHDNESAEADLDEIFYVFMYAAPLEECAEHEQHHGVCRSGDLLYRRQQRPRELDAQQQEHDTGDRAEDERVFENVCDDAQGLRPVAVKKLERHDGDGVEHGDDYGYHNDDRTRIRSGHERRRQRQTDDDEVRAVNALDLHAALCRFLLGQPDISKAEKKLDKHADCREYEQLRLHRARQIGGVNVVKQHHRHEVAKQQLIIQMDMILSGRNCASFVGYYPS